MIIGYLNNVPQKISIKRICQVYYLRWWYNGWHYWAFKPGQQSLITEGEKYRTIGTKSVLMGTGQITYDQCQAIRTIMNTREVYILTIDGWKHVSIAPGSVAVYDNQVNGYEVELSVKIGSKEISVTGFSPIEVIPNSICDYFLPSKDELNAMYTELHLYGVGGFADVPYWSSSEGTVLPDQTAVSLNFGSGTFENTLKGWTRPVRACRSITSTTNYNLRDVGPMGGLIFYKHDNGDDYDYLEAAPSDLHLSSTWSNITNIAIGTTDTTIGIGQINTTAIITQHGAGGNSAAKLCDDYCNSEAPQCGITIGTQIWMCKNYDSSFPGSKIYNNDETNRAIYGGLYTYDQIITPGFCPDGWHVPTLAEWTALINEVGDITNAAGKLKEAGITHWNTDTTIAPVSYFKAVGAGLYFSSYLGLKDVNNLWTADEFDSLSGYLIQMAHDDNSIVAVTLPKNYYLSVRLIRNIAAPIPPVTYNDYFLPSKDLVLAMYDNLKMFGVGGFTIDGSTYWTSSESFSDFAWAIRFSDRMADDFSTKTGALRVRACRVFTAGAGAYSLRDIGPTGGLICYIDGGVTYYEAAPSDFITSKFWSNIDAVAIGTTGTAVGTGQANTTAIINQVGHTDSAAKLCNDLIITV